MDDKLLFKFELSTANPRKLIIHFLGFAIILQNSFYRKHSTPVYLFKNLSILLDQSNRHKVVRIIIANMIF